jgi:TonB family protein
MFGGRWLQAAVVICREFMVRRLDQATVTHGPTCRFLSMRFTSCFLVVALSLLTACTAPSDSKTTAGVGGDQTPPAAPLEAFEPQNVDQPPKARYMPRPNYPFELRRAGVTGETLTSVVVTADGNVADARTLRATNQAFADAALECVKKWKFSPALRNGIPVNCRVSLPIAFSIGGR